MNIVVHVKLRFSELLKLRFKIAYRSPLMIFLTLLGLGMLWTLVSHLNGNNLAGNGAFPLAQTIFAVFFLVILPLSIVRSTKTDLKTNKFVAQKIEYKFEEEDFTMTGETFTMQNKWTDLHKIVEFNHWIVLYTSRTQGLFIPKDRFENVEMFDNFKRLLRRLNVPKNLT